MLRPSPDIENWAESRAYYLRLRKWKDKVFDPKVKEAKIKYDRQKEIIRRRKIRQSFLVTRN